MEISIGELMIETFRDSVMSKARDFFLEQKASDLHI